MKLWLKILIGVVVVLVVGVLAAGAVLRTGFVIARQFGWGDNFMGSPMMQGGYRASSNNGGCACADGDEYGFNGQRGGGRSMMGGQNWGSQGSQENDFREMGPGMMGNAVAADEWVVVEGEVSAVDDNEMSVKTSDGKEISIFHMEWAYAQTEGFKAAKGDKVSLEGFYDEDYFVAGKITNSTSDTSVSLRDDNGRPLWAGGGNWR